MIAKLTVLLLVINFFHVLSQPRLEITPDDIEFEDIFHRNKNVYFINTGNAPLRIDSLVYKKYNYYFLRFDRPWDYPVILQPNDSVKMDCILESYVYVPATDTVDSLFIYNNGIKPIERLKIKIRYFDDDYGRAFINGFVTNENLPVESAKVYFFYENNYIIASSITNQNGYYSAQLPPGQYAVAVEKDSYYVSFYQNKYDPINADLITLKKDSTKTVNIQIDRVLPSGLSVSGVITDSISLARIKKGVLIVRTGIHTPNKITDHASQNSLQSRTYTAFVKSDGSYHISHITTAGYYFIQAFSDYYLPSFYNYQNKPAVFWQQADSILIDAPLSNVNIIMLRDSSVGGGRISGTVTINSETSNLKDVLIYVKSMDNNLLYNYSFLKSNNEFKISNLPYGNYKLLAQKIGFNDGMSTELRINPTSTVINGVIIPIFVSSIEEEQEPHEFQLMQNYPNPFNPTTTICYTIPFHGGSEEDVYTILKVYDILGNEISTLVNEHKPPGFYQIEFNAASLTSGIYFYALKAGSFIKTKKMLLLR